MMWLNGLQNDFVMAGGRQSARSPHHLCELCGLTDQAGLLRDIDRACSRTRHLLAMNGADA